MLELITIPAVGIINGLRGHSLKKQNSKGEELPKEQQPHYAMWYDLFTSKAATTIYMFLLFWAFYGWEVGLIVALGFLFHIVWHWGTGFLSIFGWERSYEIRYKKAGKWVRWVPWLTDKLYTPKTKRRKGEDGYDTERISVLRKYGVIWMTLRGLYIVPLFVALYILYNSPLVLLYGLLCAYLKGLCYYITPEIGLAKYGEMPGHVLFGIVLGAALWLAL